MATLPKPEVTWPDLTFAQIRFDCGPACSVSYFFEAKRRRLSGPRRSVLAVDVRRWLIAAAEERALVVRQIYSGREVARIERDWAPGAWLGDVIRAAHFDPDGRLSFTWLRGPGSGARERARVDSLGHRAVTGSGGASPSPPVAGRRDERLEAPPQPRDPVEPAHVARPRSGRPSRASRR